MLGEIEGTKLGFIVEHVEVFIEDIVVDELNPDFFLTVGKRTIISVFTFIDVVRVVRTEFLFVGLRLIQLLDSRMGLSAVVSIRTFLSICDE